ncbi:hypothetical protein CL634_10635 [bacterium]|nr:hypothetical protein [bacterium]
MGLIIRGLFVVSLMYLTSCTTTRKEMFQGEPIPLKPNQVLVKSIHQRNFEIWLENEKQYSGIQSFKDPGPCPDAMGHGQ